MGVSAAGVWSQASDDHLSGSDYEFFYNAVQNILFMLNGNKTASYDCPTGLINDPERKVLEKVKGPAVKSDLQTAASHIFSKYFQIQKLHMQTKCVAPF